MKKFPISEIFTSPQGEGLYTGVLMTFVRLAGCSVGKKITSEDERLLWAAIEGEELSSGYQFKGGEVSALRTLPVIAPYREVCTLYDGRPFLCDTDFRPKEHLTAEEILDRVPEGVERVCITGGEPLNHDLTELLELLYARMLDAHIETSGTVPIQKAYPAFQFINLIGQAVGGWIWLTVSPKFEVLPKMLDLACEVKLLVDKDFDPERIPPGVQGKEFIYIQPVNKEFSVDQDNMRRCLELQKRFPAWRLSSQSHKIWCVR